MQAKYIGIQKGKTMYKELKTIRFNEKDVLLGLIEECVDSSRTRL